MIVMLRSKDETARIRKDLARKCPREIRFTSETLHGIKIDPEEAAHLHRLVIQSDFHESWPGHPAGSFMYKGIKRVWIMMDEDTLAIGV